MASDLVAVENRLWATADQLWANTGLKPSEFSTPVLGLIFLRHADKRFTQVEAALAAQGIPANEREAMDYHAEGVLYLPLEARISYLVTLTESANLGKAIGNAMALVEQHNPELQGVLPRGYNLLPNATLVELLRLLAAVDLDGDAFGKVYEYFLGNFALKEGQKGGVFFTPTSIGSNFFYTVTLPCTLWFFDKAKAQGPRKDAVLFLDARPFFKQVTRSTREFTPEQLELLANVVRLHRGEAPEFDAGSQALLEEKFPGGVYADVAGLCKAASRAEIEAQGWSLNPGRYVGVGARAADEFDFAERLEALTEEFEVLNLEAAELQVRVTDSVSNLLQAQFGSVS